MPRHKLRRLLHAGLLAMALLLPLLAVAQAVSDPTPLQYRDAAEEARFHALAAELRCVQCQNQSIADSPVDVASDLRRQVREMIAAGQSDADIKRFMTDRYGDFVLYDPPLRPRTLLLWAAPVLLPLLALAIAARVILRRARAPVDAGPEPPG